MQDYYKHSELNEKVVEDKSLTDDGIITAKQARDMTNNAIIKLIKNRIFPEVEKIAKGGKSTFQFTMARDIEYYVAIDFLKTLGYKVNSEFRDESSVNIRITW